MSHVKLIQLNIEGSRHLSRILPFFEKERPDVLCLQEVFENDIPEIALTFGMSTEFLFSPNLRTTRDGVIRTEGSLILSRFPMKNMVTEYYTDKSGMLIEYDNSTVEADHRTKSLAVIACDIHTENADLRIATTHFTWTPDGMPGSFQHEDLQNMLRVLKPMGELVLTGDFNAPRGGEIFSILENEFVDHVPKKYLSSLDPHLHRVGHLELMVDGIFSTPSYAVTDVAMICGVSDHCALRATIAKK